MFRNRAKKKIARQAATADAPTQAQVTAPVSPTADDSPAGALDGHVVEATPALATAEPDAPVPAAQHQPSEPASVPATPERPSEDEDPLVCSVRELRERGLAPKEIARALGVRPAAVSEIVRRLGVARAPAPAQEPFGCFISPGWSAGLMVPGREGWPADTDAIKGTHGLVKALVVRTERDRLTVCAYLIDTYCLGVKNAYGPRRTLRGQLADIRREYFGSYDSDGVSVPLELVREVVYGAVDYARGLGFEPHRDFARASKHLGDWSGPSAITFGKNGRPCYVNGPDDNPGRVLDTLKAAVGKGNFEFIELDGEE